MAADKKNKPTAPAKFIYILAAKGKFFRFKFGITNHIDNRTKAISKSEGLYIYPVAYFEISNPPFWEKLLLALYSPLRCWTFKGDGKTEWVWLLFPVLPILLLSSVWLWQRYWIWILFCAALGYTLWWHVTH